MKSRTAEMSIGWQAKAHGIICLGLLIMAIGVALAFTTSAVIAGSEWQGKCRALNPQATNEVTAPEFEVILQSNGITVRGSSYIAPGASFQGFEWTINLKDCTYRTQRLVNDTPVPGNTVNDERFRDVYNEAAASEVGEAVAPTGNYLAGIKIVSKDPPGFWLAATTNKLYWTTYPNGTVQWYRSVKGCTGYTTPLNTHWYVSGCSWLYENPYYSADRRYVYNRIQGFYYNYDFMDPNQRTNAEHYSKITGRNDGSWLHQWWATHSGEFYWLLRGEVVPDYP